MAVFDVPSNMTNLFELIPFVNDLSSGWLGIVLLLIVFVGVMIVFSASNSNDAFIAAGFSVFAVSFPLRFMGVISDLFFWLSMIIFLVAIAIAMGSGKQA